MLPPTKRTKRWRMDYPDPGADHCVDVVDGILTGTTPADLAAAFQKFANGSSRHLCVFFHGGLVDPESALETARS